jgi:hypothetical protein
MDRLPAPVERRPACEHTFALDPSSHQLRAAIIDYLRDVVGMDDRWAEHHGRNLARAALQIAGRDALLEATRCRRMLDHEVARSRAAQAELVALRVALHRYATQEDDEGAAARAVLRGFLR